MLHRMCQFRGKDRPENMFDIDAAATFNDTNFKALRTLIKVIVRNFHINHRFDNFNWQFSYLKLKIPVMLK